MTRQEKKKAETINVSAFLKDWRLPTLAEAIQPLPSALQCLTAVFGMGTGRTTAVMPPKMSKERLRGGFGGSLKTTHRGKKGRADNSRVEIAFP